MYTLVDYVSRHGKDPYEEWVTALSDQRARVAIRRRVLRLVEGNFGDHRSVGEGVLELRLSIGPGYRVYYALIGNRIVLLLCGGDKASQRSDIKRAKTLREDWNERFATSGP